MSSVSRMRPNRKHSPAHPSQARPLAEISASRPGEDLLAPASSPLSHVLEGLRGKVELLWENGLAPVLGWIVSLPVRLLGGWGGRARVAAHTRRRLRQAPMWSWNEEGVRMLKQSTRMVLLAAAGLVVLALLAFGAVRAGKAFAGIRPPSLGGGGGGAAATPTTVPAITIRNISGDGTIPPAPQYTIGLWASNNTPGEGGSVTIYAKVENNTLPVPGVKVSLAVDGNTLTATTNRDGIASFNVVARGPIDQPDYVTGSVTIGGGTISNSTFFSPI